MMELGLRRLAVGVVGLTMAVVGLFLSVTVPVIVAVLPQLQARTYEEIHVQPRRRIPPPATQQHPQENFSPASSHAILSGADAPESSDSSSDTLHSLVSSTHHATSTPPSSLHNSPEARTNRLPLASSSTQGKSNVNRRTALQHICTPQRCSKRATTSASGSEAAPQESAGTCVNRVVDINEVTKNARPARALPWLKASPPPPPLHFQMTPRSSAESTRHSAVDSPTRAATFDETALGPHLETHLRSRRAGSLFGHRRIPKASTRAGSGPMIMSNVAPPMTPIDEGVRSEPASPSSGAHDLHEESSDAERPARERKRRVSYLTRLKRKYSGKRKVEATQLHDDDSVPTSDLPETDSRGRSLKKRSSRRLCERQRKLASAPTVPPPRTNPYDAPYYFPSPASPEAINYVQLARSENRRASVSPSSAGRTPHAKESGPVRPTTSPGSGVTQLPGTNSASSPLQNVPVRNVRVAVSAPGRHRKSVSDSAVSPAADEFGFVLPISTSPGPIHTSKDN